MQAIDPAGKIKSLLCDLWNNLKVLAHGQDGAGTSRPLLTDTGGRQVTVTAPPIEVRSNIGALAASSFAYSDIVDLGIAATRQHTLLLVVKAGVASAGETLMIHWSDDGVAWNSVTPASLGGGPSTTSYSSASGPSMCTQGRPMARYARVLYSNGTTPQTALLLAITAIAGI